MLKTIPRGPGLLRVRVAAKPALRVHLEIGDRKEDEGVCWIKGYDIRKLKVGEKRRIESIWQKLTH